MQDESKKMAGGEGEAPAPKTEQFDAEADEADEVRDLIDSFRLSVFDSARWGQG